MFDERGGENGSGGAESEPGIELGSSLSFNRLLGGVSVNSPVRVDCLNSNNSPTTRFAMNSVTGSPVFAFLLLGDDRFDFSDGLIVISLLGGF